MEISVFEALIFMDIEHEIIKKKLKSLERQNSLSPLKSQHLRETKIPKETPRNPVTFLIKIPNIYHAFARFVICINLLFAISSFVVNCC